MDDDPILELRDLAVGGDGTRHLDGVSIGVRRGDRLGIVVEDDSSRSALIAALLGDVDRRNLVRGDVRFNPPGGAPVDVLDLGRSDARRFRWRRVAFVPSNAAGAFNPSTSVGTAFEETLRAHGADVSDGMERASDLVASFGRDAEALLDAVPGELRAADLERAALALALLLEPAALVVEESETALALLADDVSTVPEDLAVVAVGSRLRPVASFADRLAVLYGGKIVEDGPTATVLDGPEHPYTRELVRND